MTAEKPAQSPQIGPIDPSKEAALEVPDTVPNTPGTTPSPSSQSNPTLPFKTSEGIEKTLPGQTVGGRYLIGKLLGTGGFGSVFKAKHVTTGQSMVVKVLRSEMALEPVQVKRFFNEAKTTCQLTHPHTVRVFDFGRTDEGLLYMAMEFLDGKELAVVLKKEAPLEPLRVIRIASAVLKSLAEAHAAGLVHRDLKPGNIFLCDVFGERDFVKLIDFGIAKAYDDGETEDLTKTGFAVGTPKYMSPEQGRAEPLDGRSDLYSLGVIMYEALSGNVPFKANSAMGLIVKHMQEQPRPIQDCVSSPLPKGLAEIVMKSLEKSSFDRFADADDMRAALEKVLDNAGVSVSPNVRAVSAKMRKVELDEDTTKKPIHAAATIAIDTSETQTSNQTSTRKKKSRQNEPASMATAAALATLDPSTGLDTRLQRGLNQSSIVPSTPARPSRNHSTHADSEKRSRGGGFVWPLLGALVIAGGGWAVYHGSQDKDVAEEFKRTTQTLKAQITTKLTEPKAAPAGQREIVKPRLPKHSKRKAKYDKIIAERHDSVGDHDQPLSNDEIDKSARSLTSAIRGCYRRHAPAGNFRSEAIDVLINRKGRVESATMRDRHQSKRLATCCEKIVRDRGKFRGGREANENKTLFFNVGVIKHSRPKRSRTPQPSSKNLNGDAPL